MDSDILNIDGNNLEEKLENEIGEIINRRWRSYPDNFKCSIKTDLNGKISRTSCEFFKETQYGPSDAVKYYCRYYNEYFDHNFYPKKCDSYIDKIKN